jgi:hypothetical protein
MNDTKVVRYEPEIKYEGLGHMSKSTMMEYNNGAYVTHADYRALEEDRDMWFRDHGIVETELREAREELAALRVRVGQLPDARPESEDINEDTLASGYDAGWNRYREAALVALGEVK